MTSLSWIDTPVAAGRTAWAADDPAAYLGDLRGQLHVRLEKGGSDFRRAVGHLALVHKHHELHARRSGPTMTRSLTGVPSVSRFDR